jgi:type IV secretory pathway VirD2 relaxase
MKTWNTSRQKTEAQMKEQGENSCTAGFGHGAVYFFKNYTLTRRLDKEQKRRNGERLT